MSPKRLFAVLLLAFAASVLFVPSGSAGNFDESAMGCTGEAPATCPSGTVGQPYSMTIYLVPPDGGRGEDFNCATFRPSSGTFPPGLIVTDEGYITGTPTQAGTYRFYLTVEYQKNPGCYKLHSDDEFIIEIKPGQPQLPKLTIGPEAAPVGTVGTPYSLQMTSNLSDAKTWSLASGTLPAGLSINPSNGLISGTPTTAGSSDFTVRATIDQQRTDTKSLRIDVRDPLRIATPSAFGSARTVRTEVGLDFDFALRATGGLGPYEWTQTGELPAGIEFDVTDGSLTGEAEEAGTFRFTLTVEDAEGRTQAFSGMISVAERLAILTRKLRDGRVGAAYRFKLAYEGGFRPYEARIKRGPLPKGIRLDRTTGTFVGVPARAGIWVITVEVVDELGVKATSNVTLRIKPALARRR